MQVPSLTQPTAKASWQVDTLPSADPVQPTTKPGAGKSAAAKAAVQAPQVSTPTGSSPLPADVPDSEDAAPTGPVRCLAQGTKHLHKAYGFVGLGDGSLNMYNVKSEMRPVCTCPA